MDLLAAFGLSVPAGLNAYIPLLAIAVSERAGWLALNKPYDVIGEWWAIALIAVLLAVELVADKVPAVDHVNDITQTVVRPAAGGIAFAAASGQVGQAHPVLMVVVGIILAGTVHAVKATTRPVVQTVTAGMGGAVASVVEDVMAVISSVLAIVAPVFAAIFILGCVALAWLVLSKATARLRGRPAG